MITSLTSVLVTIELVKGINRVKCFTLTLPLSSDRVKFKEKKFFIMVEGTPVLVSI